MERGKYPRTLEIRLKNSLSNLGHSAHNKGQRVTEERRKEISEATKKGMTQEVRLKISLARKGKRLSEETKMKISLGGRGKQRGEKHYNWKGGKKRIGDDPYYSREYAEWRMKVFKRDNFTCVFCKTPGKRIQADHILPKCLFPKSAFLLSNGRTLCVDCHKATPTYGVNKKWMTAINIRPHRSHLVRPLISLTFPSRKSG